MPRSAEYEALPTNANGTPTPKRRRKQFWMIGGVVLAFLALVGIAGTSRGRKAPRKPLWSPPKHNDKGKRPYLRVGALGPEGFGSALQHFKQSIVLSEMLDASLILAANEAKDHGYSTSWIYNGDLDSADFTVDARKACRIKDFLPAADRDHLVRGLCAGDADALQSLETIKADMEDCTSIVDTNEGETTEDLNGCVVEWVRERLGRAELPIPSPFTFPPTRPITVGVHIRWGDTAYPNIDLDHNFRGSMALRNITRVLKDIRAELGTHGMQLSIDMERADPAVLALLEENDYTLIDSGDDVGDLHALSGNDILLLGESSYGVLAHLIAPPGLTIVDKSERGKYTNTSDFGRHLVFLNDYSPELLRLNWSSPSSSA
ncbi:hypothetical protein C8R43DRAFT_503880 [Mycena crocata]|nr:hypothetical protein C8R43DRAFT_503880 [Mycena crocata]